MAWVGDVLSTTSSFVVLLASPFIMRRRISGMVYCSVPPPPGVWVTVETLMVRSPLLESSDPTGQR
jgi:hypothetical protein